jgi:hypothetical protein
MAQYDHAMLTALNVTNATIDSIIAQTTLFNATEVARMTGIRTKIDASADISKRDMMFLEAKVRKGLRYIAKSQS